MVPLSISSSCPNSRLAAVACVLLLAASPSGGAVDGDPLLMRLEVAIVAAEPSAVADRQAIHYHPELGYEEVETARRVAERLRALGFDEVRTGLAKTGVVGVLRGGGAGSSAAGPVVAIRADMDALPVTEATDLPFRSTRRTTYLGQEVGVAHACGHDVHTAAALGAAVALAAVRDALPGTVLFIFQPDEEGPPPGEIAGALAMVQAGVLVDPKPGLIVALHSFSDWGDGRVAPVGGVGLTAGPSMAAVDQFRVTIRGKQAHGAQPHLSVDPIVLASQVVLAFQTIRSRVLPPLEPSVLTVGSIHGGERFNIIPAEVQLEGTVRTYAEETRMKVKAQMHQILGGLATAAGGSYELEYLENAPAVINDPSWTERLRPGLERALGAANVVDAPPTMAGEDFSYLTTEIPGFYFRLGVVAPGTTSGGLHTPSFRADDSAVVVGIRALSHLAIDALRQLGEDAR